MVSSDEEKLHVFMQALKEVPKSGEVWCEGARMAMNPLSPLFDLVRCLVSVYGVCGLSVDRKLHGLDLGSPYVSLRNTAIRSSSCSASSFCRNPPIPNFWLWSKSV